MNEASNFISVLARTLDAANRFIVQQLDEAGLSGLVPSHGDILAYLFDHENVCMNELAKACKRDPSTVTTLVKKLSALGYVEAKKSDTDKRITVIFLTEKGKTLQDRFKKISKNLIDVQMQGVDMREFANAKETLSKIRNNFERELEREKKEIEE